MSTWSKKPPSEPGWYAHRWTMDSIVGYCHVMLEDDGQTLVTRVGHLPLVDVKSLGGLFGPRIPSPETLARVEEFLRELCAETDGPVWTTSEPVSARACALLDEIGGGR